MTEEQWSYIEYFSPEEFKCPCCGRVHMDIDFMIRLDRARREAGVPFIINSGFRCPEHNEEVGSSTQNHPLGVAADISCTNSHHRFLMLDALLLAGFKRIGIHEAFIHVDSNHDAPPEVAWLY